MRRFNRLQERPTIRVLQLEGVIVARRPESNHFWIEKADSASVCVGGTYKTDVASCNISELSLSACSGISTNFIYTPIEEFFDINKIRELYYA